MNSNEVLTKILEADDIDWQKAINFDFDSQITLYLHEVILALQLGYLIADENGSVNYHGSIVLSNNLLSKFPCKFGHIGKDFHTAHNDISSLIDGPISVGRDFSCCGNKLTSLTGAPKSVGGYFECSGNNVQFTESQVREICQVGGNVYTSPEN